MASDEKTATAATASPWEGEHPEDNYLADERGCAVDPLDDPAWECGRCGQPVPPGLQLGQPHDCEVERLRTALTYYAEGRIWDNGEIAREALRDADA